MNLDETPALQKSFKAATILKRELPTDIEMEITPLIEPSSLAEDIHTKTRAVPKNMREFWGSIRPYKPYRVSL